MSELGLREQRVRRDDGQVLIHKEAPSRDVGPVRLLGQSTSYGEDWESRDYYGVLRRYDAGFPLGGGPWAILSISHKSERAVHDFRDFQQLKNALIGEEWEAVELYPAESRLVDASNRYYLYCVPKGVFPFGFDHRKVLDMEDGRAPQRPFPRNDPGPTSPRA